MITVSANNRVIAVKRDYRSAARLARKESLNCNYGRVAFVEFHKKGSTDTIDFAVMFKNGERVSDCTLKEKSSKSVPKSKWENDAIQFPRLIAELEAAGAFTADVMTSLCDSMDLDPSNINELVDRAQTKWEKVKSKC